ncbi:MAG TPA: UDP-N-acetylmuramoyl-tripeptide--D-alanyl-D-alanine ligase [Chloroflexota bacterium]
MTLDVAAVLNGTAAEVVVIEPDGTPTRRGLHVGDLSREFSVVSIDSRLTQRNALFVALPGERVDGHDFVTAALRAGALGALVSRIPAEHDFASAVASSGGKSRYLFVVSDTLRALQQLGTYWRRRHSATVVGITGSIGKTTTKEIVSSVLASSRPVLKSVANLNTEIGLPLMLLNLEPKHEVAVLEMGMYEAGDIALLARIAEPQIGIVTTVAPIHLERMRTIEAIAREKSRLVTALPPTGLAVLNADDPWTRAMAKVTGKARSVLAGLGEEADYQAIDVAAHGLDGTSFTLVAEGEHHEVRTQVAGAHTIHAFLTAAAVARVVGMTLAEVRDAMEEVRLDARQRIIRHRGDMLIIDDSYNAAPMSMNAALALLDASPGTKIAVLGDMLELGPAEESAHRELGERAAEVADWLVVRGPRGAWIADAAERHGLPAGHVVRTLSNAEALQAVREVVGGDIMAGRVPAADEEIEWTVLVKGSRGMQMEEVVAGLRGER